MRQRRMAAVIALGCALSITASGIATAQAATTFAPAIPSAGRFTGHVSASTTQVIVVSATTWRSTTASITIYNSDGLHWTRLTTMPARLGYGGLVTASHRVQDTGATPAGQFGITETFGRQVNPGTAMPFVQVTNDDWWVEDRASAFYNQMHSAAAGGFRVSRAGFNSSEQLAAMGSQYDYAAVINFNRPNPVVGRGAGIFLHAFGRGLTAGCVSVAHERMQSILRWLDPTRHPRIIIGPAKWLNAA